MTLPKLQKFSRRSLTQKLNSRRLRQPLERVYIFLRCFRNIRYYSSIPVSFIVRQILTWSAKLYSSTTNQCAGQFYRYESPQTVTLKKISGNWMISSIVFDVPSPDRKSC